MQPFINETALAAPIAGRNVDTDQIIPARFLKADRAAGYGRFLFHDLRFRDAAERHGFRPQPGAFQASRNTGRRTRISAAARRAKARSMRLQITASAP